jgi:hypothetical protein
MPLLGPRANIAPPETDESPKLKLGDHVRDVISGFEGILICKTEWLYQCVRYGVSPTRLKDDGSLLDNQYFDEGQLELVEEEVIPITEELKTATLTGGDREAPRAHPNPSRGGETSRVR